MNDLPPQVEAEVRRILAKAARRIHDERLAKAASERVSLEEAGTILGVGRSAAYAMARAGDIPTIREGRRRTALVSELWKIKAEIDRLAGEQ